MVAVQVAPAASKLGHPLEKRLNWHWVRSDVSQEGVKLGTDREESVLFVSRIIVLLFLPIRTFPKLETPKNIAENCPLGTLTGTVLLQPNTNNKITTIGIFFTISDRLNRVTLEQTIRSNLWHFANNPHKHSVVIFFYRFKFSYFH
jgi:hypothetical protein